MSEKTLKFGDIEVDRKEFYASTQPIGLNLVDTNKIVISNKFKHSDKGFKYFIDYTHDNIVRLLCIILPKVNGYIKYFKNGGKTMSFMIEDDSVLVNYNEIWNMIKKTLNTKFHSMLVYDEKYIKAKVHEFNGVINTNFCGYKIPREGVHHTCIASRSIDSVMKMDKKNYRQVYPEECKYKIKKIKMAAFTDVELESYFSSDSE